MPKLYQRYAKDMLKIWQRYARNNSEPKNSRQQPKAKICQRYARSTNQKLRKTLPACGQWAWFNNFKRIWVNISKQIRFLFSFISQLTHSAHIVNTECTYKSHTMQTQQRGNTMLYYQWTRCYIYLFKIVSWYLVIIVYMTILLGCVHKT